MKVLTCIMMLALVLKHLKKGSFLLFDPKKTLYHWAPWLENAFLCTMIYLTSPLVNHTFPLLWERDRERKGFNTRLIPWQTQPTQKPFYTCCTSTHASHVLGGKWSRTFCFTFHLVKILLTFRWKPEQNQCFSQLNTLIEDKVQSPL